MPRRTSSHNAVATGGHKDGGNSAMSSIRLEISLIISLLSIIICVDD